MITPRRTRLLRVPNLHAFRNVIRSQVSEPSPDRLVLVPTRGAAHQLARSFSSGSAVNCVTRDGFYDASQARLSNAPSRLSPFERESMMQAAAASAEDPPFQIRPGLIGEMLHFYDQLRRQSQSVKRFQELLEGALGGHAADIDRGAERLLRQTRFLSAAFRDYERRVIESGSCDEHTLRDHVLAEVPLRPLRHVVVTVPDWIADPNGLYVADFDLLARMPGLLSIDIVCTESLLGSGFHERLHGWWPGVEEEDVGHEASRIAPRLLTPPSSPDGAPDQSWFTYRDREEELIGIARRLQSGNSIDFDRVGVVFNRPLPYLYLAADTLGSAGIPFQSSDALPLAAEPTAAVVDLVLDAVETNFTRSSLLALLRTPHLELMDAPVLPAVAALDRRLSDVRYLGELPRLEGVDEIPATATSAFNAALTVARELAPLLEAAPASRQIGRLRAFLETRFRLLDGDDPLSRRELRARAAILQTLIALADAHATHHDPPWTIDNLAASVRRWIGEQTFVQESTGDGVRLVDDQAARYAELDELTLVGLVENEWPERPRRNIFYPPSLLKALGCPSEKDRRGAGDARFLDLLGSAAQTVALSTFTLDDEALVSRSTLLDEVPRIRLSQTFSPPTAAAAELKVAPAAPSQEWFELRMRRSPQSDPSFHGALGAQPGRAWSVSALETYLNCPFQFFAQHVLRLQEEPDDEEVMDPRRAGQFVHEVFEHFFRAWQTAGRHAITPDNLNDARRMFADVVEEALARLPHAEAGLERTRLLGSSAAAGLGEAVLRMEAERPVAVVKRLLEHRLDGSLLITTESGPRSVSFRGKTDRLDLLADGTFRLIDYKLGWPPNRSRALQLPIYGLAAAQQLSDSTNRSWTLSEAVYLAFKGPRRVVPLFASIQERDEVLAKAQQRLADTIDAIDRGEFPPKPDDVYRCDTCSFASVCRKDYVGDV